MTDPTAEAINWALERAACIADEACDCGVGKKLAAEIRALKVTHEAIDCSVGTPEELEEMGMLERFAAARGPVAEANLRAINTALDNVALAAPPPPFSLRGSGARAIVAADGPGEIASAPIAQDAIISHEHDRKGPMVPVNGIYRMTCTCGQVM